MKVAPFVIKTAGRLYASTVWVVSDSWASL